MMSFEAAHLLLAFNCFFGRVFVVILGSDNSIQFLL